MSRPELVEKLHDVKKKWYSIGVQLKVPESTLDEIEGTDKHGLEGAFCWMIQEWLEQIKPEPTWAGIVKVLCSRSVDKQRVANTLKKENCAPSAKPHYALNLKAVLTEFG